MEGGKNERRASWKEERELREILERLVLRRDSFDPGRGIDASKTLVKTGTSSTDSRFQRDRKSAAIDGRVERLSPLEEGEEDCEKRIENFARHLFGLKGGRRKFGLVGSCCVDGM